MLLLRNKKKINTFQVWSLILRPGTAYKIMFPCQFSGIITKMKKSLHLNPADLDHRCFRKCSKSCLKQPLKNRPNKDLNDKR